MMKRILVPLDGSALAERALPSAAALAQATGAALVLLRVVGPQGVYGVTLAHPLSEYEVTRLRDAEAYLTSVARAWVAQGLTVEPVALAGQPVETIVAEAARRRVDLLVLTTHGWTGLGRWEYGSVVEGVLARTSAPVLLIRSWTRPEALAPPRLHTRILVPLDGTPFAEAALPIADTLATALVSDLVLLRTTPPRDAPPASDQEASLTAEPNGDDQRAAAERYLRHQAGRFALGGYLPRCDVQGGEPAEAIVAACREHQVGLVVMATHGVADLDHLLLGSVAARVLRYGDVPLLLVRPAPATDESRARSPVAEAAPGTSPRAAATLGA